MASQPKPVELRPHEVVRVAKEIIEKWGKTLDPNVIQNLVNAWYKDIETSIDLGSKLDLVHAILALSLDGKCDPQSIRSLVIGYQNADQHAVDRLAKCLGRSSKLIENPQ